MFNQSMRRSGRGLPAVPVWVAALACACAAEVAVSPDDPNINYYGRFDLANPKAPRFNWSGTAIEFSVSGTATAAMEMTDGAGYYDVEVDGKPQASPVFVDSYTPKSYPLASGLSPETHRIRIVRRNEAYGTIATFGKLILADGGKLAATPKPARKMEFVGDSWTAGYFNEACADQQKNTNTNKAWARLTSKAFHAQDVILAESGIGLAKSLGGKTVMPKKYLDTFDTAGTTPNPKWNFASWKPDIVTVFLGINDKNAGATESQFIAALHAFVTVVRGNYPDAAILFVSATGGMDAAARTAVAAETTSLGHARVYWHECKTVVTGCQYHPTLAEDQIIANAAIARISQIMGWDTAQAPVSLRKKRTGAYPAAPSGGGLGGLRGILGAPYLAADGRVAGRPRRDGNGEARWDGAAGVYLFGNREAGWARMAVDPLP
jgi:lysophospholipase L1-like esterase